MKDESFTRVLYMGVEPKPLASDEYINTQPPAPLNCMTLQDLQSQQ